jgi:hypothetical protein
VNGEGMVLDGRNRYRACVEVGIEPITKPWDQRGSALAYVISKNLHRRHLDTSQRAMVGARIESYRHGGDRRSQDAKLRLEHKMTRKDVSALLNVGERSINSAATVHDLGIKELQQAVDAGDVSVSAAREGARLPKAKQSARWSSMGATAIGPAPRSGSSPSPVDQPQLHFELRQGAKPVDPLPHMEK